MEAATPTLPTIPVTVIRSNSSWLNLEWRSLVAYRDLLWLLVQRDFTSKYKQTILGPIWFFLNPLITTAVFTLVFARVIGVSTDGVPPMLFYLCGMLGWTYFSNVLTATSNALVGNAGLFSKVYFPRLIPPLAVTLSNLLSLGIQLITFVGFYVYYLNAEGSTLPRPNVTWLLFPVLILHMAALGLGIGLILSALTAKYRDLQHVQAFIVNIWMYLTPIIYPLSRFPEKWQWFAAINPMTSIVEAMRLMFLGGGSFVLPAYLLSVGMSALFLLVGLLIYQRAARTFVDIV
ncbi:MAG: ABC transporter permease [Verrucomicrobiota bacterium]